MDLVKDGRGRGHALDLRADPAGGLPERWFVQQPPDGLGDPVRRDVLRWQGEAGPVGSSAAVLEG